MSRIKSNAALTVIDVVQGMGRSILGYDLLRFPIQRRRKTIIELLATMPIEGIDVEFRVLGFWHKKDRVYRWYITNLNCSRGLIYDLYRLRWQLELSFKSMKSHLNFDRIPTTNQNTVSVFILVTLINYVFATILREDARIQAVRQKQGTNSTSMLRASKLFSSSASTILELIRIGKRLTKKAMTRLIGKILPLLSDVLDPNYKKRKSTLGRLQNA